MSHIANQNLIEAIGEKREEWLEERGLREEHIMTDETGEYVFVEEKVGPKIEDRKIYLPLEATLKSLEHGQEE